MTLLIATTYIDLAKDMRKYTKMQLNLEMTEWLGFLAAFFTATLGLALTLTPCDFKSQNIVEIALAIALVNLYRIMLKTLLNLIKAIFMSTM